MRDMYSTMHEPIDWIRVYCDCGKVFAVEDAEPGDHWDAICPRCHLYWDDTMAEDEPFPVIPEVGMRPYLEVGE